MKIENRTTHEVQQGSPGWHELRRLNPHTASRASAMMGCDPNNSRTDLLDELKSGVPKEVSSYTENVVFKNGHEAEPIGRAHIEKQIAEDLFPLVITATVNDLPLLSSTDGLTMTGHIAGEIKQWNKEKVKAVKSGKIPDCDYWQAVQTCLVSGAETLHYALADVTEKNDPISCVYERDTEAEEKLMEHWQIFHDDLAEHEVKGAAGEVVGTAIQTLPTLDISVTAEVSEKDLAQYHDYKTQALALFEGMNRTVETDQDVADAKVAVKFCGDTEKKLKEVKEQIIGRTGDLDTVMSGIDEMMASARQTRLALDKQAKGWDQKIRARIVKEAEDDLQEHIDHLEELLNHDVSLTVPADFVGAMKNKRTEASLREAVTNELTDAKARANRLSDKIRENLKEFEKTGEGHGHLFPDMQDLVTKNPDDFQAVVKSRVSDDEKRQEAKRQQELAEAAHKQRPDPTTVETQPPSKLTDSTADKTEGPPQINTVENYPSTLALRVVQVVGRDFGVKPDEAMDKIVAAAQFINNFRGR